MAMAPGTRLGPYELTALIGAGGMGEVYRARDAGLGRDVAIKILPTAFATDRERLQRFEQEARAAAALNHPNILAIHAIGYEAPADGLSAPYIVSELLEGETLRRRLQLAAAPPRSPGPSVSDQGPLPARKAIEYAVQIARGLAAAHEKGIVHRDLKPENIFVIADGRVKILDFGLAKLTEIAPQTAGLSHLPTESPTRAAHDTPYTLPGVILGTVGYMSPEQVRGVPADHRSDIFSLGAILYEMLAGRRAFRGETAADTMSAILSAEPPDLHDPEHPIPSALLRIVDRCLEKAPGSRFQSASDLTFAMEALSGQALASDGVRQAPRRARVPLLWVVPALLLLATVVFAVLLPARPVHVDNPYRSEISVPGRLGASIDAPSFAVSPDGRRLAFVGPDAGGRVMLWVRPLDSLASQPLAGTEGAAAPFWSPDSRFVAFVAGGKLMKIEASGGPPSTVADASLSVPGTWSRDDEILFTPAGNSPLWRVPAAGGRGSAVTSLDAAAGERAHAFPVFLPDGRRFLYRAVGGKMPGLYAASLDSRVRTRILDDAVNVQFSEGTLLYMRGTTLVARRFDPLRLAFSGDEVALAERVWIPTTALRPLGESTGAFSVGDTGALVYQSTASAGSQLVWFDRAGQPVGVLGDAAEYADLFLSPDGRNASVSVATRDGTRDIWTFDVASNLSKRFTFDPGDEFEGVWAPDNSRIAFNSSRDGSRALYVKSASGSGSEELLVRNDGDNYAQSWSPDSQFLLYIVIPPSGGQDLWYVPMAGDRKAFPYLTSEFTEGVGAEFSPDGRWVAYTSTESGGQEVYVASFPVPDRRWRVSIAGGLIPQWRADGREIFYFEAGNSRVMAAEVTNDGAALRVGTVRPLFNVRPAGDRKFWDAAPDGQRFLVNTALAAPEAPLTLLVNWTALLAAER
jgi:serine/threonine protein kinase/Tol biopolymer transport system component